MPGVERLGLLRVLVDLVLLHPAPDQATPDHIAVLVDELTLGRAQEVVAAHADGLIPREALEDDLVRVNLEADVDEALQPAGVLSLAVGARCPGVLAREAHLHVVGVG